MGAMLSRLMKLLFGKKEMVVVMVGRNAAGKTTIVNKLKLGEVVTTNVATVGFHFEVVEYKNISFTFWEVGGQTRIADIGYMWKHCLPPWKTSGLIFVVDSNYKEGITDAKDDLHTIFNEDYLRNVTLLVFANKQDLPNAMSVAEITDKLGLHSFPQRRWHIQPACATSGEGLYEGLDWLCSNSSVES